MSREKRLGQCADERGVAAKGGLCGAFRHAQEPLLVGLHGAAEAFGNGLARDGGTTQAETAPNEGVCPQTASSPKQREVALSR